MATEPRSSSEGTTSTIGSKKQEAGTGIRRAAGSNTTETIVMRLLLTSALMGAAVIFASPAAAQVERYEIDPEHLSIGFLVEHLGYASVLGMFRAAKGSYSYNEKSATLGDVRVEVDTASVYTNHRKRDDHLKGPDFLNSGEFPKMTFIAASAQASADKTFEINGSLSLLGRSLPMTLKATLNKLAEYELGTFRKPYVMGVSARGSFKRSTYGMTYGVENGWVGDDVSLIIEFEARRQ